jgi:hypothetical protein
MAWLGIWWHTSASVTVNFDQFFITLTNAGTVLSCSTISALGLFKLFQNEKNSCFDISFFDQWYY